MAFDDYMDLEDDDEELEEEAADTPYDSISSRPPLPASSAADQVKQAILSKRTPPRPSLDLSYRDDPMMQSYEQDQAKIGELRQAKAQADLFSNLGSSFGQLAMGTQAPRPNLGLYDNLAKQSSEFIRDEESNLDRKAKVQQAIENRMAKQKSAETSAKLREAILANTRGNQQARMDKQKDKETIDRFDLLNKTLNEDIASGRSTFGLAARTRQAVENAEALLNGEMDYNDLDNRQVYELSKVVDRILSQGNPTISGTEHLTPDTARGWLAKKMEYFSNQRQGAQAGDFVKNISHTLKREKEQSNKQIMAAKQKILSSYKDLQQRDHKKWDDIMNVHGLVPFEDTGKAPEGPESPPQAPKDAGNAGRIVRYQGKLYKVGADGDSLEEIL